MGPNPTWAGILIKRGNLDTETDVHRRKTMWRDTQGEDSYPRGKRGSPEQIPPSRPWEGTNTANNTSISDLQPMVCGTLYSIPRGLIQWLPVWVSRWKKPILKLFSLFSTLGKWTWSLSASVERALLTSLGWCDQQVTLSGWRVHSWKQSLVNGAGKRQLAGYPGGRN